MTKISEKIGIEDGKLYVARTHDVKPTLDRVKAARDGIGATFGQGVKIGTIPGWLLDHEMNRRGVSFEDEEGRRRVMRDILLENAGLRVSDRTW